MDSYLPDTRASLYPHEVVWRRLYSVTKGQKNKMGPYCLLPRAFPREGPSECLHFVALPDTLARPQFPGGPRYARNENSELIYQALSLYQAGTDGCIRCIYASHVRDPP